MNPIHGFQSLVEFQTENLNRVPEEVLRDDEFDIQSVLLGPEYRDPLFCLLQILYRQGFHKNRLKIILRNDPRVGRQAALASGQVIIRFDLHLGEW